MSVVVRRHRSGRRAPMSEWVYRLPDNKRVGYFARWRKWVALVQWR